MEEQENKNSFKYVLKLCKKNEDLKRINQRLEVENNRLNNLLDDLLKTCKENK